MPRMPHDAKDWLPDLIKAMNVRYRHAAATQKRSQYKYQRAEELLRTVRSPVWVAASSGTVYNLPDITPPTLLDELRMIARQQKAVVPRGMEIYDPDSPSYMPDGPRTMVNHEYFATIRKGTGAYAILRAMYERMRRPDQFFTLRQIEDIAAPYCDTEMRANFWDNRLYAGISSLKTLEKYQFVRRIRHLGQRHELLLTQEGYQFAKAVFDHKFPEENVVGGGAYDHLAAATTPAAAVVTPHAHAKRETPRSPAPAARAAMPSAASSSSSSSSVFTGTPRFIQSSTPHTLGTPPLLPLPSLPPSSPPRQLFDDDAAYEADLLAAIEESKAVAYTPVPARARDSDQYEEDLNVAIALSLSTDHTARRPDSPDPPEIDDDDTDRNDDDDLHVAVQLSLLESDERPPTPSPPAREKRAWPPIPEETKQPDPAEEVVLVSDVRARSPKRARADPALSSTAVEPDIVEIDADSAQPSPGLLSPKRRKRPHPQAAQVGVTDLTVIDLTTSATSSSQTMTYFTTSASTLPTVDLVTDARISTAPTGAPRTALRSTITTATTADFADADVDADADADATDPPVVWPHLDAVYQAPRVGINLSDCFKATAAYTLPRHRVQQPGFLELAVDVHERSSNADYLQLYNTMGDKLRSTCSWYDKCTDQFVETLRRATTVQQTLWVGDFAFAWVNGEQPAPDADNRLMLDVVVERKKIRDLVQRSAGPIGDHAEQLCRLRCAGVRHRLLLIEGCIATAGAYQPFARGGADLEGPDVIDDAHGVIALVCRQIVQGWPGYDVKVMHTLNPAASAVAMAQLGVCMAHELADASFAGPGRSFPKLKDFNRTLKKQRFTEQRESLRVDLLQSGVHSALAEMISDRFGDWGLLHTIYAVCKSDVHRAALWDHYCEQLAIPLAAGEAVWRANCVKLGAAPPVIDQDTAAQLHDVRSGATPRALNIDSDCGYMSAVLHKVASTEHLHFSSMSPRDGASILVTQGEGYERQRSRLFIVLRRKGVDVIEALLVACEKQAGESRNPYAVAHAAAEALVAGCGGVDNPPPFVDPDSPELQRSETVSFVFLFEGLVSQFNRGGAVDKLAAEVNKARTQRHATWWPNDITWNRQQFSFEAAAFVSDLTFQLPYLLVSLLITKWNCHVQLCGTERETIFFLQHFCDELKKHALLVY